MGVRRMVNPVMGYAWGSQDGIATLQGRPPSDGPEAELWMGAHPLAPSALVPDASDEPFRPLDAVVSADPGRVLGEESVSRFGPHLPFMLKVLAAARPLSLQVHPDAEQARAGFEAEERAGIDRAAPQRCFRDPHAKPELLVALTPFELLLGFRPADQAAATLERLGVPRLDRVVESLREATPTGEAFLALLDWPDADRAALVADVREAASAGRAGDAFGRWIDVLAQRYADDPAVVGIVLLNYVALEPGQAVFVAPGQLHGYLRGTAMEALASSDNVARAGLTDKHLDLVALRDILSTEPAEPALVKARSGPGGVESWPVPEEAFELTRIPVRGATRQPATRGAQIVLCLEGGLEVVSASDRVHLNRGESAFVPAGAEEVCFDGDGVIVRIRSGLGASAENEVAGGAASGDGEAVGGGASGEGEAPSEAATDPGRARRRRRRAALEWLVFAVVVAVGTFLIRTYVVQTYTIPSASMEKTLNGCTPSCNNDRILVNKLAYKIHGIHRGDIVVFKPTSQRWLTALGTSEDVVKRVIGLPGDTLRCCDAQGRVIRNGAPLNESYVSNDNHMAFGPVTVPSGDLWVMGDNRADSDDSRFNGPIKESSVIGHAFFRVWPLSRIGFLH